MRFHWALYFFHSNLAVRMSDAKAKAEARRAKILAREGDRLSLAKGEKVIFPFKESVAVD